MNKNRILLTAAVCGLGAPAAFAQGNDGRDFKFQPNTLVLSRSVYAGDANTVTVGQTLPPGCMAKTVVLPGIGGGTASVKVACGSAVSNGEYPNLQDDNNVWNNDGPDGSFGVTSPIFLDNIDKHGKVIGTLAIPTDLLVTSFSSKSELA